MTKITDSNIRRHLHHGEGDRVVRIHRDGLVEYRGSTDPYDRSQDNAGWMFGGWREELVAEIERDAT